MTAASYASSSTPPPPGDVLVFHAANVTGSQEIPVEFGADLPARSVTDAIAHRMALPSDVTWSLRDDGSSVYLDDDRPIGDQIGPGAHVSVIPKTHLGGTRGGAGVDGTGCGV
jgi:hypothetical protein